MFALGGLNDYGELTRGKMTLEEKRREIHNREVCLERNEKIEVWKVRNVKLVFMRRRIC